MSNFFKKLTEGLKKSSSKLTQGLNGVFRTGRWDAKTLEELEELLIESDMGVRASANLIARLQQQKQDNNVSPDEARALLTDALTDLLAPCQADFELRPNVRPFVILMVGVNGAGKTTSIGKLAARFQNEGKKVSFIAADTFRAAAVEQLKSWGEKLKIRVFSGANGCDGAGLCYDGLKAALAAEDDVVLIDTAGRLQNKSGLMDELQKIIRVIRKVLPDAPHQTLLTLDATTGQNAVSQVEVFRQVCQVDGLIVTKLDGSSRGGVLAALAVDRPIPVYFIGVGEGIDDLNPFKASDYAQNLLRP